jgi:hypothetical protein
MNSPLLPAGGHARPWFGLEAAELGGIVAGLVTIVAALLTTPAQHQFLVLYLVAGAVGLAFVMRVEKNKKTFYAIWASAMFAGVVVLALPQLEAAAAAVRQIETVTASPEHYYMSVLVYADTHGEGNMTGLGSPLKGVEIIAHEPFGPAVKSYTDRNTGEGLIQVPSTGFEVVGVCDVYQTHYLGERNNSPESARKIKILVSANLLPTCQQR